MRGGVDAQGCYSPAADAAPPGVDGGGGGSVGRTSTSLAAAFIHSISSDCWQYLNRLCMKNLKKRVNPLQYLERLYKGLRKKTKSASVLEKSVYNYKELEKNKSVSIIKKGG